MGVRCHIKLGIGDGVMMLLVIVPQLSAGLRFRFKIRFLADDFERHFWHVKKWTSYGARDLAV